MQVVNQLKQPSGSINPNTRYSQDASSSNLRTLGIALTTTIYLVIAISLISLSYFDNGYLLTETVSGMGVVGLLLILKLLGKGTLEETKKSRAWK